MFERIVVGVDGSQSAEDAARTAARLAEVVGAELHLVIARHDSSDSGEEAAQIAEQVAVAVRHLHPELTLHVTSVEGRPADALVRAAEAIDAGLIVVGNKRVQGIARVLGSVASEVTRKAACDVYVAHTSYS